MRQHPQPFSLLIATSAFCYATFYTWDWRFGDWFPIPYIAGFLSALFLLQLFCLILYIIFKSILYWWIKRPKGRAGKAGWMSHKEMRKNKLFWKWGRFFVGAYKGFAVYVGLETSGLVLSPAGGGKTIGFVIPALMHNKDNMIVPDLKGTLAVMTAKHRQKKFKHEIIILNPAGLYAELLGPSACYNPLQIIIDDWNNQDLHKHLLSDARSIAKQLYPEVADGGRNIFWHNGARKVLVFGICYVVICTDNPTLSHIHSILSDPEHFESAMGEIRNHKALSGDFARLAKDLLRKIEDGNSEHSESFREGALQRLEVFAPSGALAENTSHCDFRFKDLKQEPSRKHKRKTIYILADPTRAPDYAPWIGLLSWCALTELIRAGRGERVVFLCDEATNFKIHDLPPMLTLVREFNIVLWIIIQELAEWAKIYGDKSLQTLISQTEVKLIMGANTLDVCRMISDILGDESIMAKNYNLGHSFFDPISKSLHETGQKLMTSDEVRRSEEIILLMNKKRPVKLDHIGYHEVHPWRKHVGINPLFGKKFKGRMKVKI